ncbi:unnamed protein product [Cochlearia groenlandica]
MGNILRRSSPVHPACGNGGRGGHVSDTVAGEKKDRIRIKVRMRRDKLEELLYLSRRRDHKSDGGGGTIGFLILKECMEGRLPATVVSGNDVLYRRCGKDLLSRRLISIKEE